MNTQPCITPPEDNSFYRSYQSRFVWCVIGGIVIAIIWSIILIVQIHERPLPIFYAVEPRGNQIMLQPQTLPSVKISTILALATKGATASYTLDFVNYKKQMTLAHYYFTESGWNGYLLSILDVIESVKKNQLFIYSVVNGQPVISRQGMLKGVYTWEVQMPFLVTYQSSQQMTKSKFLVTMNIISVPTNINPVGLGINSFVMERS